MNIVCFYMVFGVCVVFNISSWLCGDYCGVGD